jgi:hypothetical protein
LWTIQPNVISFEGAGQELKDITEKIRKERVIRKWQKRN